MLPFRSSLVLARITLLEAVRNRILLVALAFTIALIGLSISAAAISIGERARLIIDVGLAAASAMGSLIAVALAVASFGREIDRHTAYPVLARPLPRRVFVLGKYLGTLATMVVVTTLMMLATAASVWMFGDSLPRSFWPSLLLVWLEMAVVIAVALAFSCYTTPVLAATYTVALVIAGNFASGVRELATKIASEHPWASRALAVAYYVLPDFEALSLRTQAANDLAAPPAFVAWATLYAVAYVTAALALGTLLFTRKRAV